jgi:programmed cell death protein 4
MELKDSMDQLLKEYLLSRELDEAASCVRELKSAHFHHELVKRGVRIAMEEDGGHRALALSSNYDNNNHNKNNGGGDSSSLDAMAALFVFLVKNSIVSEYQVAKGIDRLRRTLDDIKLDVPAAPEMLDEFEIMAKSILLKKTM